MLVNYTPKPDFEAFVWAMWLLFRTRPSKQSSEPDGSYFIGEVGKARLSDQRLQRETPYSTCRGIRNEDQNHSE